MSSDVIVLGAGAAGLCAALAAVDAGARVTLLERSEFVGGTMAQSAGVVWVPVNHRAAEAGYADDRADALRYLESLSNDRIDPELAERYVDTAPEMLRWLEGTTGLTFGALPYPDYHSEHPGAAAGGGRSVEPGLYPFTRLGVWADRVVISPAQEARVFLRPAETPYGGGTPPPPEVIEQRKVRDERAWGQALVGGLLGALLERGVEPVTGVRAVALEMTDGRVTGVRAEDGRAWNGRVVIATGGFDGNETLKRAYLRGPLLASVAVPENTGDGLLMAQSAGASLGAMSEAWWVPIMKRPGSVERSGRAFPRGVTVVFERSMPGSIIVNRAGRRFVNEAANYNAAMGGFHALDPNTFSFGNLPAYLVFDADFRRRVPVADLPPGDTNVPEWMWSAPTVRELAGRLDVDPDGLDQTVERFNKDVAGGRDPEFGRGGTRFERANGDPSRPGPLANLGPLREPPYYAVELLPGAFGTRGGPRTDRHGRVLSVCEEPIPGLYAAGNAMASVLGMAYPGGGGTLGSAFTFGYLAGRHAAGLETEDAP